MRGANDGLWDWDLENQRILFSSRWKEMLGWSDGDIGADLNEWWSRVHPEDIHRLRQDIDTHLAGDSQQLRNEHRMLHADGTYRWMLSRGVAVRNRGGVPTRMAGSQTDITDRKVHDPLTGLPNRALFLDRLQGALKRNRRSPQRRIAVLFLDLDRFKLINDSLGHLAGDQLLTRVARTLEASLRPEDTVARFGGDEFVILVEDIQTPDDAVLVAERIVKELADPFYVTGQEVFTYASIGIALSYTGNEKPEDLMRDADTAMYRAKASASDSYRLFDQQMRTEAVDQLKTEMDLRRALERREFEVYYQPIVKLSSGEIECVEALVRWRHPTRGLLRPHDFIAVAEETGFILPIGCRVLETACGQLQRWRTEHPETHGLKVAVNLSPRQFSHPRLIRQIGEVLTSTGLPPQHLQLEITESAFIDNIEAAVDVLTQIRQMGVDVAIDDFGTGYSSLSFLDRFPVNLLKIDRSFISKIHHRGKPAELVATMIAMADKLGIEVVAEGVESAEQRQRLVDLSCDYMQGYEYCPPVDADEISERLLRTKAGKEH